jgi:cytoskeleton protein RodZ
MTIGSELRQAREQRGLTLVQISERTRVRVATLRAIEADDFRQLPGGVISRGFLKLYAREVGLDAGDIVTRFRSEFESEGLERREDADAADAGTSRPGGAPKTNAGGRRAAALAVALVALVAIGYVALKPSPGRSAADAGSQQEAAADATAVGSSPAPKRVDSAGPPATAREDAASTSATAGRAPAAPAGIVPGTPTGASAPSAEVLRVDLEATAACWISATVDGAQVAYRALNPGERLALRATAQVVLRIGIPANLNVSINDRRVPPFERPGTPVTLRITPGNYRDLFVR